MKKIISITSILTTSFLAFLSTQNATNASSTLPNDGNAGAPMDNAGQTCTSCHGGTATNTTGVISSNIPASGYVAGSTYNFTVSMSGASAYGFEMTPQTPSSNVGLGTWIAGTGSSVSSKYIKQSVKLTGASATWTFQWTAPSTATTVTFYGAFNYANNNNNSTGDIIKTSSITYTACSTPSITGSMSGNVTICSGSSNTYSISPVSGATSYSWSLPGGWTGTSSTNTISTTASSTSGNISVTASNSCGASPMKTLSITVNSSPSVPTSVSGSTIICAGTSNTYSVPLVNGASSYIWTLPSSWTGSSNTNTISTTAGSSGGNILVSAMNSCGTSPSQTLNVSVSGGSALPQPTVISGNTMICANSSNTYSVAPVSGANSYIWTLPSGWSGASNTNTINTTSNLSSGTISVSASNTCSSSAAQTLAIVIQTVNTSVTQSGISLTANNSGATYQWINCSNNLPINNAITQSYTASSNGAYAVIVTSNGCSDTSACFNITSVIVNELNLLKNINVYPNPTNGKIILFENNIELNTQYKLIIYDINNHIIFQSNTISSIDISDQPNGIYLLKIYNDEKYSIKKIIKQ